MFLWSQFYIHACVQWTLTCAIVDTIPESLSSLSCSPPASLSSAATAARASALQCTTHILTYIYKCVSINIPFSFFSYYSYSFCSLSSVLRFCFPLKNCITTLYKHALTSPAHNTYAFSILYKHACLSIKKINLLM